MSVTVTSGYSGGDEELDGIVDQTCTDLSTFASDEVAYQDAKSKLMADLDTLDAMQASYNYETGDMGSSDACFAYIITVIFPDMLDCTEMQIKMESDAMAIGVDAKNLTLLSQDEYNAILSGDTGQDANDDAECMVDSLNMLLGTDSENPEYMFTITYPGEDGEPVTHTANGLLDLMSTPEYWPDGLCPMSATDADSIALAAEGVTNSIGTALWDSASATDADASDYEAIVAEVDSWLPASTTPVTTVVTNEDGSTTATTKNTNGSVQTVEKDKNGNITSDTTTEADTAIDDQSANMEDAVNSGYSTMESSEDQNYQKEQMYLQQLMNYYNQTADEMSSMMEDYNAFLNAESQKMPGS